jgi:hypothetical protein
MRASTIILALLATAGRCLAQDIGIGEGITGKDLEDYVRATKVGCEQQQHESPIMRESGIALAKLSEYCDCYAQGVGAATTKAEAVFMMRMRKTPPSLLDKSTTLGHFCAEQIFGAIK